MNTSPQRTFLGLVFLIVFLDVVGFAVLFPLFPRMLTWYVQVEGEASSVGRLAAFLTELAGTRPFGVIALFGATLGSLYSALQFLFAPLWGALSDRIGRRPTLLLTSSGICLSYVLWFFAGSFLWFVVARILGGAMAGNISTASAVVADTCEAEDRAKGMGIIGMAVGLGFVLGPAVGGLASLLDLSQAWPEAVRFGVNPFSSAALAALVLATFNLVLVFVRFEETLPPERRGARTSERSIHIPRMLRRLDYPGIARANVVYLLFITAFSAMEFTLTFLATERFDFTPRDNMWMFVFIGLTFAFVQGGLVRRMAPRLGEKRLVLGGLVLILPGLVALSVGQDVGTLYLGLFAMSIGSALAMPCLSALVSRYTPSDRQGLAQGALRSVGALSRAIGPFFGGLLYWRFGSAAPYLCSAALLLLPIAIGVRLPAPRDPG